MEQPEQYDNGETPSYWPSVALAGLIFGVVLTVLSLVGGYMYIDTEPTGSLFNSQIIMTGIGCLIAAFGGMVAIWHYNREYGVRMKLGRGALIGLFTGIAVAFFSVLLSQIWNMIDPAYAEQLLERTIATYEASDMFTEEQKQSAIDTAYNEHQNAQSLGGILKYFLISSAFMGILNMLSGMLGVGIFARERDEI